MKIVPFEEKHKEQVRNLIFDVLEGEFGHHSKSGRPDVKNISEHYQKDSKSNFWVALDENDSVVGTIALSNLNENIGNLRRLYVKTEMRGQGIAGKLFSVLLDFAKGHGYKEIYLSTWETATDALRFYEKHDFERISQLPEKIAWTAGSDNVFYKLEIK